MWTFFSAPENLPFTVALGILVGLAVIEILGAVVGFAFSHILDGVFHIDFHPGVDLDADGTHGLEWIGFGAAPSFVVLLLLLGFFGGFGLAVQAIANSFGPDLLNPWAASALALVLTLPTSGYLSRLAGKHLFKEESLAVSQDSFIGKPAVLTLGTSEIGKPAQAKLKDQHGQAHYVMVEPVDETDTFRNGDEVLIVDRVGPTYKVVGNSLEALSKFEIADPQGGRK